MEAVKPLLTNLPRERFPLAALKQLYTRRWGIETSFRKLKYTVGLLHFHGKKTDFVMQELYARLTMYNYAEAIVSAEAREKQSKQHAYQINFTTAFHICKAFLRDAISPGTLCKAPTAVSAAYPPRTKLPAEAPYQYGHYLLVSGRVTVRGNRAAPRRNDSSHYVFIAFYILF